VSLATRARTGPDSGGRLMTETGAVWFPRMPIGTDEVQGDLAGLRQGSSRYRVEWDQRCPIADDAVRDRGMRMTIVV
jgi:hypothetical protein